MLQTKHTKGRTAMKKIIGMDLGDKKNVMVVLDETGKEIEVSSCINTAKNIQKYFSRYKDCVVVMEAGTHSAWIGRSLTKMGHEVHVGNPRKLRAIWDTDDKSDKRDARVLALMYRLEPRLLHEVFHRSEEAQMDLELIKARNQLVESRSKLINHVRGAVKGVGPITALAFVLTLETPERFGKSRVAGAFPGLTPRRDQSGDTDKQLRITKAGNTYMRQLLISCAHYILGPFGPDSDLRFYGQRIAARGGKNAKKRAVVAVARKLAVLLHRLWITKDTYVAIGFKESNVA